MKLKQLTVKNFVKFKDFQTINFGKSRQGGVHIFVGANETGKSSMVEAIRRCSALRLNESCSRRYEVDEQTPSFAACIFEGEDDGEDDVAVSYYMVMKDGTEKDVVMKVLIARCQPTVTVVCWGEIDDRLKVLKWYEYEDQTLAEDEINSLTECTTIDVFTYENYEKVMTLLKEIHNKNKKTKREIPGDTFDKEFDQFTRIEFLFAHRGISPIQSSEQLGDKNENLDRYKAASKNAFVIKTFLENPDPKIYDVEKERKIFNLITSSTKSNFEQDEEGLILYQAEPDQRKAPILKVSEGIVEAKVLSILLSKLEIGTLVLEEPGRGMHKNYIDILLNRIFTKDDFIGQKTVIITTHNRDFVAPSTLQNMVFFSKNTDGSCRTNMLQTLVEEDVVEERVNPTQERKICNFITSATVSSLFFSRYSICVEGKTDAAFIQALKKNFLDNNSLLEKVVMEQNREKFRNFLATLNVIELNSKDNAYIPASICKRLGLEDRRVFLLDRDALYSPERESEKNSQRKQKEKLKQDLILDVEIQDTETDFYNFENQGVFIWNPNDRCLPDPLPNHPKIKKGSLEHAMHETWKSYCEKFKDQENNQKNKIYQDAKGYKAQMEEKSKKMILEAQTDKFVEDLVKNIIEVSVELNGGQIFRFIKFLGNRIS